MRFVDLGLTEDILVPALHRQLDGYWTGHSDIGDHESKIAPMRERVEHIRDNPVAHVGIDDHGDSVEEVVTKAESLLAGLLREAEADSAAECWVATEKRRKLTDLYLSSDVVDGWLDARLRKYRP